MAVMIQTFEVTGPPGVGKSTYIQDNFSDKRILSGYCPNHYGGFRRSLVSIPKMFLPVFGRSLSRENFAWLFDAAQRYDESFLNRMNAVRNCMLKFSVGHGSSRSAVTIIDEGISHIPFILGLSDADIVEFVGRFHNYLTRRSIVFLCPPTAEVLCERLMRRGHRRIKTPDTARHLVSTNLAISDKYSRALDDTSIDVTYIHQRENSV